ncbi:MAG: hypothetical protein JEZ07_09365 [Phycisphaerae bacterium]|nr:hypothetical protein [Phycisphaerae bacterium]
MNPKSIYKTGIIITSLFAFVASIALMFSVAALKVARDEHKKSDNSEVIAVETVGADATDKAVDYKQSYIISAVCFGIFLILFAGTLMIGRKVKAAIARSAMQDSIVASGP